MGPRTRLVKRQGNYGIKIGYDALAANGPGISATSAGPRSIRLGLAEQPLPERPSRRSRYDAAAADTAG
jgi:hypothetical protein